MKDIKGLKRPMDIGSMGVEADLLWSDPSDVTFIEQHGMTYSNCIDCQELGSKRRAWS